jgi:hypothetical protein
MTFIYIPDYDYGLKRTAGALRDAYPLDCASYDALNPLGVQMKEYSEQRRASFTAVVQGYGFQVFVCARRMGYFEHVTRLLVINGILGSGYGKEDIPPIKSTYMFTTEGVPSEFSVEKYARLDPCATIVRCEGIHSGFTFRKMRKVAPFVTEVTEFTTQHFQKLIHRLLDAMGEVIIKPLEVDLDE